MHTLNKHAWLLSEICVNTPARCEITPLERSLKGHMYNASESHELSAASWLHCLLWEHSHLVFQLCTQITVRNKDSGLCALSHMGAGPWALNDLGAICQHYLCRRYGMKNDAEVEKKQLS